MLSIERCDKILRENEVSLEPEKIKELRDYLVFLAELQVEAENNRNNENDYDKRDSL